MFVVVTVKAQQLPVAAIKWVVVVIVVSVMNRQFGEVLKAELSRAAATDPGVELQGSFPIAFLAILLVLAGIGHHLIQFVVVKSASASDRHREAPVEI